MGRRYQEAGRHRDAVTVLTRLSHFRFLPSEAAEETQARLAEIHLKRRKYKQARRHLTAALRHQPENARYHYLLATALQAEEGGDLERAAGSFAGPSSSTRTSSSVSPTMAISSCVWDKPRKDWQVCEAVERSPEDVEVLGKLVKGLRLCGLSDEAALGPANGNVPQRQFAALPQTMERISLPAGSSARRRAQEGCGERRRWRSPDALAVRPRSR